MLKKTITYTDLFTEEEVTEDHYFHISKADLVEMEVSQEGGMQNYLTRIVKSEDGKAIMAEFKSLMKRAYGRKEGDKFIKSERAWEEFVSSEAYSTLFYELCTNAEAAGEFINGIIPKGLDSEVAKITAKAEASTETPALSKASTALATEEDPTGLTNHISPRVLTPAEVDAMEADELKSGLATGRYKLS